MKMFSSIRYDCACVNMCDMLIICALWNSIKMHSSSPLHYHECCASMCGQMCVCVCWIKNPDLAACTPICWWLHSWRQGKREPFLAMRSYLIKQTKQVSWGSPIRYLHSSWRTPFYLLLIESRFRQAGLSTSIGILGQRSTQRWRLNYYVNKRIDLHGAKAQPSARETGSRRCRTVTDSW